MNRKQIAERIREAKRTIDNVRAAARAQRSAADLKQFRRDTEARIDDYIASIDTIGNGKLTVDDLRNRQHRTVSGFSETVELYATDMVSLTIKAHTARERAHRLRDTGAKLKAQVDAQNQYWACVDELGQVIADLHNESGLDPLDVSKAMIIVATAPFTLKLMDMANVEGQVA